MATDSLIEARTDRGRVAMQIPLQITFKDMDPSPAIEARIREKAAELERFFAHVSRCHVVVSSPHRHHRKGRLVRGHHPPHAAAAA